MKTISIGRSQDNDVVLDNSQISRHHCELIQYDDGKVAICDNNSMNGTFVNGERISGKRFLQMSDSVRIGPIAFNWTSYVHITHQHERPTEHISYNNPYESNRAQHSRNQNIRQERNQYAPTIQLRTHRSLLKYFFLSLITLGIYRIVVMSHISSEINYIASKYDHRNTPHYCLVYFLLSWLTLGIYPLVWFSNLSSRIGGELVRRNIPYSFGAGTFWGWDFFGIIIIVGPFIYIHKLFKAMNLLCSDYNKRG